MHCLIVLPSPSISFFVTRSNFQQHTQAAKLQALQKRSGSTFPVSGREKCWIPAWSQWSLGWSFPCSFTAFVLLHKQLRCANETVGRKIWVGFFLFFYYFFFSVTLDFNFFMSLLCLVLFIMPCGRSYLWLIILKQFLYFISAEFPLEDATKEANHANKAL